MISIILVGFGGVGRSLLEIILKEKEQLMELYSAECTIRAICELDGAVVNTNGLELDEVLALESLTDSPYWQAKKTGLEVIKEIDADFLVECSWTNPKTGEPALSVIKTALRLQMNVVSSNKGPFYLQYHELFQLAKEKQVHIGIESTVGSAIPCLASKETLSGGKIIGIRAILNGTSNYILSRMTSENLSFSLALKEAQDLGYAEADPTLDIEGYDAAGKLVILANELLHWEKKISDVEINGITQITSQAIALAKSEDQLIKHVAVAENGKLWVGLQLVEKDSPLAVNGTLNVVELTTQYAGPITYIGRGAGRPEAAAGILSNILSIARLNNLCR